MPLLINDVRAELADNYKFGVTFITADFGMATTTCGYIDLGSFKGFVFNNKKVISTEVIAELSLYGLSYNANNEFKRLVVSY